jgi:hypothetical protein
MGLDMWLPSIYDFNDEQQAKRILNNVAPCTDPMKYMERMFDALRATGGYYREGYGGRGLLSLMGMSWHEIIDSLEDRTTLPPAHARHLLAELEARPFTKAMLFGEERRPDPLADWLTKMTQEVTGGAAPPSFAESDWSDQQIEEAYRQYAERRLDLMALLRTAIERDEPLRISG